MSSGFGFYVEVLTPPEVYQWKACERGSDLCLPRSSQLLPHRLFNKQPLHNGFETPPFSHAKLPCVLAPISTVLFCPWICLPTPAPTRFFYGWINRDPEPLAEVWKGQSQGWKPGSWNRFTCSSQVLGNQRGPTLWSAPQSQGGELYGLLTSHRKMSLKGEGLGKEGRKEFYVPEDRAASPDLGVLEGRSPEGTRAGPPWWQTYRRAGKDQGRRSLSILKAGVPATVKPAAYVCHWPMAKQGVPVTSRAGRIAKSEASLVFQPHTGLLTCVLSMSQLLGNFSPYHFKIK